MGLGFDHERELMSPHKEKLALFIDAANLYATAKSLGFDIDYKRLLREFQSAICCGRSITPPLSRIRNFPRSGR
jgi:uncharacterized LabA/DUF88 family protein